MPPPGSRSRFDERPPWRQESFLLPLGYGLENVPGFQKLQGTVQLIVGWFLFFLFPLFFLGFSISFSLGAASLGATFSVSRARSRSFSEGILGRCRFFLFFRPGEFHRDIRRDPLRLDGTAAGCDSSAQWSISTLPHPSAERSSAPSPFRKSGFQG